MTLLEPVKKAIELVPAKWQTLVLTPLLLVALTATTTMVYASRQANAVKDAKLLASTAERVDALARRVELREAHDDDRDRRLRSIERGVREIQRDLAAAMGNAGRARDAQRKINELPPEDTQ